MLSAGWVPRFSGRNADLPVNQSRFSIFLPGNEFSGGIPPVPAIPGHESDEAELPAPVLEKIEDLFKAAEKDNIRAPELKREFDRLKLFEKYEDRFLDLFRKNN